MTAYTIADYVTRWADVERASAELRGLSLADELAICEDAEPGTIERLLEELGPDASLSLAFDWDFWARPKQRALLRSNLGLWRILLVVGGRGGGKTRPATEWVRDRLETGARELVLVGPTYNDIEQYMLGGVKKRIDAANGSGLFDILPPWIDYDYKKDEGTILIPQYKAVIRLHSAELPEYRGPAPDTIWGDELVKWRYPDRLISNLRLACRDVGKLPPQLLFTTTPRKLQFMRDLVMDPNVVTLTLETRENAGNVDEGWLRAETQRLGGTAQGAEELGGKLGVDEEGTIFKLGIIDKHRADRPATLDRVVVSIDPAASQHETSDMTGIVGVGRVGDVHGGHGYVLDEDTKRHTWSGWAVAAWDMLLRLGGSAFVLERNYGADACASNLRDEGTRRGYEAQPRPGFKTLTDMVHVKSGRRVQIIEVLARDDKATRARTVQTLYERERIHHCGNLERLESEQTSFDPAHGGRSPNGLDALVHGFIELFALDRPPEHDARRQTSGLAEANKQLNSLAARGRAQGRSMGNYRGRTV